MGRKGPDQSKEGRLKVLPLPFCVTYAHVWAPGLCACLWELHAACTQHAIMFLLTPLLTTVFPHAGLHCDIERQEGTCLEAVL